VRVIVGDVVAVVVGVVVSVCVGVVDEVGDEIVVEVCVSAGVDELVAGLQAKSSKVRITVRLRVGSMRYMGMAQSSS
jgi:hypothetical protein